MVLRQSLEAGEGPDVEVDADSRCVRVRGCNLDHVYVWRDNGGSDVLLAIAEPGGWVPESRRDLHLPGPILRLRDCAPGDRVYVDDACQSDAVRLWLRYEITEGVPVDA